MKKMVLIAGILVVAGSMYSMDLESKNGNKRGGTSGKYSPRRRRRKANRMRTSFGSGDLAVTINVLIEEQKARKQKADKPRVSNKSRTGRSLRRSSPGKGRKASANRRFIGKTFSRSCS